MTRGRDTGSCRGGCRSAKLSCSSGYRRAAGLFHRASLCSSGKWGSGAELFHRALLELGADLCLWWEAGTGLMWPFCFFGITWEHLRQQSGGAAVLGAMRGALLHVLQRSFFLSIGSSAGKAFLSRERKGGQDQASSDLSLMGNVLVAAPLRDTAAITQPVFQADTPEWELLSLNTTQNDEP